MARGFGVGCSPVAPGTLGTAVAIPLVCLQLLLSAEVFLVFVLVFILGAVYVASVAEKQMDGTDDPSIVVDEMAGFLIAMTYVPLTAWSMLAGFVLFRALDIFKPPPVNTVEQKINDQCSTSISYQDRYISLTAEFQLQRMVGDNGESGSGAESTPE